MAHTTVQTTVTYKNPLVGTAVLVPVRYLEDVYLVAVKRNGRVKHGGIALPGGHIEHMQNGKGGASEELLEETDLFIPLQAMKIFDESAAALLNPKDKKSGSVFVLCYETPEIPYNAINFMFKDQKQEIQGLSLIHLNDTGDGLLNEYGEDIVLCFPSHHRFAVNYLNKYKNAV